MILRASGKIDASEVVKDVVFGTPTKATKYRTFIHRIIETTLTAECALSLMIDLKLSCQQYQSLQNAVLVCDTKMYPSYKSVKAAKSTCYPSNITVTASKAEVRLQQLQHHTAQQILRTQADVIKRLPNEKLANLTLICK